MPLNVLPLRKRCVKLEAVRSENLKRVSRGSEILLSLATKDRCLSRLPIHELIARASLLYKRLLYGFHSCGERLYKWSFVRRERMTSPSLPSEKKPNAL